VEHGLFPGWFLLWNFRPGFSRLIEGDRDSLFSAVHLLAARNPDLPPDTRASLDGAPSRGFCVRLSGLRLGRRPAFIGALEDKLIGWLCALRITGGQYMESRVASSEYGEFRPDSTPVNREAHSSGVSWGAVLGGAAVVAAFSLILLALGAGLGLSAVSPWSNSGVSASVLGGGAIAWLILIEVIASAFGGYLTGRLRTKWAQIHSDEVYFRDTANGFLAWAVALVISVSFLATAATSMVGERRSPAESAATVTNATDPNAYFVDMLFRSVRGPESKDLTTQAEAGRIFANALRQKEIPASDQKYLSDLIVAKTNISQLEAEKRVSDVFAQAQQRDDVMRKETARLLLWSFLALMIGAFSASYAATIGGRQRDHVKAV
jgi:hypothetical protein